MTSQQTSAIQQEPTAGTSNLEKMDNLVDPKRTNIIQQHFVLMVHAIECNQRDWQFFGNPPQCVVPFCMVMKNILAHLSICNEWEWPCREEYCDSTRAIANHWYQCHLDNCLFCASLRCFYTDLSCEKRQEMLNDGVLPADLSESRLHDSMKSDAPKQYIFDWAFAGRKFSFEKYFKNLEEFQSQIAASTISNSIRYASKWRRPFKNLMDLLSIIPEPPSNIYPEWLSIPEPTSPSVWKDWHRLIPLEMRRRNIKELLQVIFPYVEEEEVENFIHKLRYIERRIFESSYDMVYYNHRCHSTKMMLIRFGKEGRLIGSKHKMESDQVDTNSTIMETKLEETSADVEMKERMQPVDGAHPTTGNGMAFARKRWSTIPSKFSRSVPACMNIRQRLLERNRQLTRRGDVDSLRSLAMQCRRLKSSFDDIASQLFRRSDMRQNKFDEINLQFQISNDQTIRHLDEIIKDLELTWMT